MTQTILPGQFDFLHCQPLNPLSFTVVELICSTPNSNAELSLGWPSGNKCVFNSVYFHDTRQTNKNGHYPLTTQKIEKIVRAAVCTLHKKYKLAQSRLLMFEQQGKEHRYTVGGGYKVNRLVFYVVTNEGRTEHYLAAKLY